VEMYVELYGRRFILTSLLGTCVTFFFFNYALAKICDFIKCLRPLLSLKCFQQHLNYNSFSLYKTFLICLVFCESLKLI